MRTSSSGLRRCYIHEEYIRVDNVLTIRLGSSPLDHPGSLMGEFNARAFQVSADVEHDRHEFMPIQDLAVHEIEEEGLTNDFVCRRIFRWTVIRMS
jgi:hypothetical protein